MDGKQVAVLVPTTLLAEQHLLKDCISNRHIIGMNQVRQNRAAIHARVGHINKEIRFEI